MLGYESKQKEFKKCQDRSHRNRLGVGRYVCLTLSGLSLKRWGVLTGYAESCALDPLRITKYLKDQKMTTGIENLKSEQKRKGRGLGKKPALFCTSLRLPKDVMDYFNTNFAYTKQAKMREILTEYVNNQTGNKS